MLFRTYLCSAFKQMLNEFVSKTNGSASDNNTLSSERHFCDFFGEE